MTIFGVSKALVRCGKSQLVHEMLCGQAFW